MPGFGIRPDGELLEYGRLLELFGLVLIYKVIQITMIIIHIYLTRNMFGQRERRTIKGIKDGVEPLEKWE